MISVDGAVLELVVGERVTVSVVVSVLALSTEEWESFVEEGALMDAVVVVVIFAETEAACFSL